jgi:hypothetical protein
MKSRIFNLRFLLESQSPTLLVLGRHQFSDRVENDFELGVILLLQRCELAGQFVIRRDQLSQAHECPHDFDIHLNRSLTAKDTR